MGKEWISGIQVDFPYDKPYGSQKIVMSKVIRALKNEKNALLEVYNFFFHLNKLDLIKVFSESNWNRK